MIFVLFKRLMSTSSFSCYTCKILISIKLLQWLFKKTSYIFRCEDPTTTHQGLWVSKLPKSLKIVRSCNSDIRWQQMITDNNKWKQVTTDDNRWHQMTSNDIRWHQMTSDCVRLHQMTSEDIRLYKICKFWICSRVIEILRYWKIGI